ncbi:hypothetical protein FOL47_003925 [Perkinsus chesapeaki]|uniref:Mitochondrial import receptor subunit TOM40B n=1 Tax=Perkinsus chesapeaki TaxID=330153 RepID=A0A7J6M5F4_PERCH|nr:hypothetical protein FOL47_003925 [Perkinsus chesapeaki]
MSVILLLFILCFTGSVAIVQNPIRPYDMSSILPDDEELSEMINFMKMVEGLSKEFNQKQAASFPKGIQQASVPSDGSFAFPPNCTSYGRPEQYSYCFHGKLNESEKTTVEATMEFFDSGNPNKSTLVGVDAVYDDKKKLKSLDARAGGEAQLVYFGNKTVKATIAMATYIEPDDSSSSYELGTPRDVPLVAQLIFGVSVMKYGPFLVPVKAQTSKVFAHNSYHLGFNISSTLETIEYRVKFGVTFSLSFKTVKNDLREWKLLGQAEVFSILPVLNYKVSYPFKFIESDISLKPIR